MNLAMQCQVLSSAISKVSARLTRTRRDEAKRAIRLKDQVRLLYPWVMTVTSALYQYTNINDIAKYCGVSRSNTYKRLVAMQAYGMVKQIKRGVWKLNED